MIRIIIGFLLSIPSLIMIVDGITETALGKINKENFIPGLVLFLIILCIGILLIFTGFRAVTRKRKCKNLILEMYNNCKPLEIYNIKLQTYLTDKKIINIIAKMKKKDLIPEEAFSQEIQKIKAGSEIVYSAKASKTKRFFRLFLPIMGIFAIEIIFVIVTKHFNVLDNRMFSILQAFAFGGIMALVRNEIRSGRRS